VAAGQRQPLQARRPRGGQRVGEEWTSRTPVGTGSLYRMNVRVLQGDCLLVLLALCPKARVAFDLQFDMNDVRTAADGAVFDILLRLTGRKIDWNDDRLATGIADVVRFLLALPRTTVAFFLHV